MFILDRVRRRRSDAGAAPVVVCLALIFLNALVAATAAEGRRPAPAGPSLIAIQGQVDVLPRGASTWVKAKPNAVLAIGDRLRTGRRSRVTIRLADKSLLQVNQLTTLLIEPPAAPRHKTTLDIPAGSIYFFSREKPEEIQFRTPLTSGAIRGTEFHLAVAASGRTEVTLFDGEVALSSDAGEMKLSSGEQAIIEPHQAPRKTAVVEAINLIQWSLYYPGVLHVEDLELADRDRDRLAPAMEAYRRGNPFEALARLPANLDPTHPGVSVLSAALLLAAGQAAEATAILEAGPASARDARLGQALIQLIASIKQQDHAPPPAYSYATEWLAGSYDAQSRHHLESALADAYRAVEIAPRFGYGWARVAELEFSFGHTPQAENALEKAISISPKNPQAHALRGFIYAARNQLKLARAAFNQAIRLDNHLANAWLGRGLIKIREGQIQEGRLDLQTAAVLEPNRSILRSYLGKAYSHEHLNPLADRALDRAESLDPADPTPWLYSALIRKQENRVNQGISELERSIQLNDNRRLYRSRMLLDSDRAIRGANLASLYRDAGMTDLSRREASRAVDTDYANYTSHLFLASSFDALRDPKQINLRFETPWLSELFLANLLSPVGAGPLSQNISQQEYSPLFETEDAGISSATRYLSNGDWQQNASQYGTFRDFSYAIDVDYRSQNGHRPNNDLTERTVWSKFKFRLSDRDDLLFQTVVSHLEGGDLAEYFDESEASTTQRIVEDQEPLVFLGYHRRWRPGSHTLVLLSRLGDTFGRTDSAAIAPTLSLDPDGKVVQVSPLVFDLDFGRKLDGYSAEAQHFWDFDAYRVIVGTRYQWADVDAHSLLRRDPVDFPPIFGDPAPGQVIDSNLNRFNVYEYLYWNPFTHFQLVTGLSYDHLEFPRNSEVAPLTGGEQTADQISPKVGFRWRPLPDTELRGLYAKSLGGVFFDSSIRLEPTQLAGFTQAFRSAIPESVVGLVPGSEFKNYGFALDQRLPTRTYLSVAAEVLESDAARELGVFDFSGTTLPATASSTTQSLAFQERTVTFTANQLLDDYFTLNASYRLSHAELQDRLRDISTDVLPAAQKDLRGNLHQIHLSLLFNHPSGVFSQFAAVWSDQKNRGYSAPRPVDGFWQLNLTAGYRFDQRRAEIAVGLLNLTDRDYRLNPLNLFNELPRGRTLALSFKFNF